MAVWSPRHTQNIFGSIPRYLIGSLLKQLMQLTNFIGPSNEFSKVNNDPVIFVTMHNLNQRELSFLQLIHLSEVMILDYND